MTCPACRVWCFTQRGLTRHWNAKTRYLRWDDERDWTWGQHVPAWAAAEGVARFLSRFA